MKLSKYSARLGLYLSATTEDIVAAFQALDLPVRMRAAAEVLRDATARNCDLDVTWGPQCLIGVADRFEREDAEKSQRDNDIEELAQVIYEASGGTRWDGSVLKESYRRTARAVLESGWRKGGDDD